MKMNKGSQILLGLVISCSMLLIAAAPSWIQYNERVVGENSPYYTDVVNRPAKQIWGNFTSQHTTSGEHKAFIFPTPIPTVAFPTPLPTATPKPDATPQPTCTPGPAFPTPLPTATPGPAFPTPLPTATPISSTVLAHPADDTLHDMRYPDLAVSSSPHTLSISDGSCHGRLIITTAAVTINLPSAADMTTYACHTLRVFVYQTSGATVINAGANTYISSGMTDTIETDATPQGSYLEMLYSETLDMWITTITRSDWTVS